VHPRSVQLPIRHEKDPRLSGLLAQSQRTAEEETLKHQKMSHSCSKLVPQEDGRAFTASDLQNARKTLHNIDFAKQTRRPFDLHIQRMSAQSIQAGEAEGVRQSSSVRTMGSQEAKKGGKAHAFGSYTKREFLSDRQVRGAPEVSGMDWHRVDS
jgi:hypothetical protein